MSVQHFKDILPLERDSIDNISFYFGNFKSYLASCLGENPVSSLCLFVFTLYYIYYVKNVVKKPELVCSSEKLKNFLTKYCPIINQEFKPTVWCAHTHAQTLLANGIRAVIPIPQYKRTFIPVQDDVPKRGGLPISIESLKDAKALVTIDWYMGPGATLQIDGQKYYAEMLKNYDESKQELDLTVSEDDGKPIAIFLPGLIGDSQTEYIRTAVILSHSIGYKTCVFNNRGRGGMKLKTARLYCATNFDDFEICLKHLKITHPNSKIVAVGISLGGIVLCRYLSERGKDALCDAAMLVSVCFDFIAGCQSLEMPGLNRGLNAHLTKTLINVVLENKEILGKDHDIDWIAESKNLKQFDERFTCKMWNYNTADEYHMDASNKDRLHLIKKPTLCINAADDMFCPYPTLPLKQIEENPNLAMLVTSRGGHIGFLEAVGGVFPYVPTFYLERLIVQYLTALKDVDTADLSS